MVWNLAKGTSKVDWVNKIHKFSQSLKGKLNFYQKKQKKRCKVCEKKWVFCDVSCAAFQKWECFFPRILLLKA